MKSIEFPKDQERKKHQLDSLVFSSRLRIARNIEGLKFPMMLSDNDKAQIDKEAGKIIRDLPFHIRVESIDQFSHETMMTYLANGIITHEFLKSGRLIACENTGDWCILLNEDDHFRIFSIETGFNLHNMYNRVSSVVSQVEQSLDFSYDENFGYLTSSVLNVGTGLRVSCLVNLFGLTATKKIENFIDTAGKIGFAVINLPGASDSGLFYIYNIFSLGISEEDILTEITLFLQKTWNLENEARDEYFSKRDELELAFEEIFELNIMEKVERTNLLYYISLLDALNKKKIQLKDPAFVRKLVFHSDDDYLSYRNHVDRELFSKVRLNLLKKCISGIRYKKTEKKGSAS